MLNPPGLSGEPQKFLNEVKAMKEKILSIPVDRKGKYVAILHYALMDKLNNL